MSRDYLQIVSGRFWHPPVASILKIELQPFVLKRLVGGLSRQFFICFVSKSILQLCYPCLQCILYTVEFAVWESAARHLMRFRFGIYGERCGPRSRFPRPGKGWRLFRELVVGNSDSGSYRIQIRVLKEACYMMYHIMWITFMRQFSELNLHSCNENLHRSG